MRAMNGSPMTSNMVELLGVVFDSNMAELLRSYSARTPIAARRNSSKAEWICPPEYVCIDGAVCFDPRISGSKMELTGATGSMRAMVGCSICGGSAAAKRSCGQQHVRDGWLLDLRISGNRAELSGQAVGSMRAMGICGSAVARQESGGLFFMI